MTPTEVTKLATLQYTLYIYALVLNVVRPKVFKSLTKGFQYLKPLNGMENILQEDEILVNQYTELKNSENHVLLFYGSLKISETKHYWFVLVLK